MDILLLSAFILQHSAMKRVGLEARLEAVGLGHLARSAYVAATNSSLLLLTTCWQPSPARLWHLDTGDR